MCLWRGARGGGRSGGPCRASAGRTCPVVSILSAFCQHFQHLVSISSALSAFCRHLVSIVDGRRGAPRRASAGRTCPVVNILSASCQHFQYIVSIVSILSASCQHLVSIASLLSGFMEGPSRRTRSALPDVCARPHQIMRHLLGFRLVSIISIFSAFSASCQHCQHLVSILSALPASCQHRQHLFSSEAVRRPSPTSAHARIRSCATCSGFGFLYSVSGFSVSVFLFSVFGLRMGVEGAYASPVETLTDESYATAQDAFWLGSGIWHPASVVRDLGFGIRISGFGIRDPVSGIRTSCDTTESCL